MTKAKIGDRVRVSSAFMKECGLPRWEGAVGTITEVGDGERKGLVFVEWDGRRDDPAWWRAQSLALIQ